jgi:ribonuclease P protein subunit RPR2
VVRSHHERWDGAGYPDGLRGEDIPLAARVFAVADVFDALTTDRPYRPASTLGEAREIIRGDSGSHFDPRVVDAFNAIDDETFIRIGTGAP